MIFGGIFLTLQGVLPGNEAVNFLLLFFWHFSLTYNVSFTEIICISMPHRLNVFSRIFHEFNFLAFKKMKSSKKILKIKVTALFSYQFVINILYYRLYDYRYESMKMCLYAGDMNLKIYSLFGNIKMIW